MFVARPAMHKCMACTHRAIVVIAHANDIDFGQVCLPLKNRVISRVFAGGRDDMQKSCVSCSTAQFHIP